MMFLLLFKADSSVWPKLILTSRNTRITCPNMALPANLVGVFLTPSGRRRSVTTGPKSGELLIYPFALRLDTNLREIPPTSATSLTWLSNINKSCHCYKEPRADNMERIIPVSIGISGGEDPFSGSWAMTNTSIGMQAGAICAGNIQWIKLRWVQNMTGAR